MFWREHMTHRASLSAIITAHPDGFERPIPRPGETLAHLVIRNFPEQWRGFVAEMRGDYAMPARASEQLLAGNLDAADLTVRAKVEDFIINRLPGYARTVKSLAELQGELGEAVGGFKLLQTMWPLERHAAGESAGQAYAKSRGVEVISLAPGSAGLVDLIPLLPVIQGQYAWLVPVGSRLEPFAAAIQLNRTLRMFASDQALGMYFDGLYSVIYRVSVLSELAARGLKVSLDASGNAPLVERAGYKAISVDPPVPFCHLEAFYGGRQGAAPQNSSSHPVARRWWQNLFEKPRHNSDEDHQQRSAESRG
jgi:hypothetical protein